MRHVWRRWTTASGLLFVPSVGPGHDDTKVRPWNKRWVRKRDGGSYYEKMWQAAMRSSPDAVSITSYNDWVDGTQIEAASANGPHRHASAEHGASSEATEAHLKMEYARQRHTQCTCPHRAPCLPLVTLLYADPVCAVCGTGTRRTRARRTSTLPRPRGSRPSGSPSAPVRKTSSDDNAFSP